MFIWILYGTLKAYVDQNESSLGVQFNFVQKLPVTTTYECSIMKNKKPLPITIANVLLTFFTMVHSRKNYQTKDS